MARRGPVMAPPWPSVLAIRPDHTDVRRIGARGRPTPAIPFDRDCALVAEDLKTLGTLVETNPRG